MLIQFKSGDLKQTSVTNLHVVTCNFTSSTEVTWNQDWNFMTSNSTSLRCSFLNWENFFMVNCHFELLRNIYGFIFAFSPTHLVISAVDDSYNIELPVRKRKGSFVWSLVLVNFCYIL